MSHAPRTPTLAAVKQRLLEGKANSEPKLASVSNTDPGQGRPPFIAIEGIDGSGKSTLARNLAARLSDGDARSVCLTREPYDPIPDGHARGRIRELLMAPSERIIDPVELAIMFAADRFAHVDDVINPALARGETVVCDRYTLSTISYQSLKLSEEFVFALVHPAPKPDLTILLDMDPAAARDRLLARGLPLESYERKLDTQIELRERYLDFVSRPSYYGDGAVIIVPAEVTAKLGPEDLAEYVMKRVSVWLQDPKQCPKPPKYRHWLGGPMSENPAWQSITADARNRADTVVRVAERVEITRRHDHAADVAAWATAVSGVSVFRPAADRRLAEQERVIAEKRAAEHADFVVGRVRNPRAG